MFQLYDYRPPSLYQSNEADPEDKKDWIVRQTYR